MADNNSTAKLLKIIIATLSLVVIGMVVFLVVTTSKKDQQIEYITVEKESLTKSLEDLQVTYAALKTNNDTISYELEQERLKISDLLEKVKRTDANNRAQMKKYEGELGTLRSIMQGYIRQIDSLNTLNQTLIAENKDVKQQAQESQRKVTELTQRTDALASKVEKGSIVKARDIVPMALNSSGKETNRSGRTSQIRVCFTLIENPLVEKGFKNIYLRVKGPDGLVLAHSENNLFKAQDTQMVYSAVREIDYQGEDIESCIFYTSDGSLNKGTYQVALFADGAQIGAGELVLK